MKTYFSRLHYCKSKNLVERLVLIFLIPLSLGYSLAVNIRNFLYDRGLMKSEKLLAHLISIGNLTTGGTGKTPITSAIANYLTGAGKKTAVISRGYGGKLSSKNTNIVSDGEKIYYTADLAGDEPYWIAENSPKTAVITGSNRVKSGKLALETLGCEVLLLDDGFQHRKLQRDINILLVDSEKEFGNGKLLPAGALREPLSQIKRADKVIIVNKNFSKNAEKLQKLFIEKHGKDAYICNFNTGKIYNILTGDVVSEAKNAAAFTGIAQPESFFNLINDKLLMKKVFPDHYLYTEQDIREILEEAQNAGANAVITTEKDAVKIRPILEKMQPQIPVCALKLVTELEIEKLISI